MPKRKTGSRSRCRSEQREAGLRGGQSAWTEAVNTHPPEQKKGLSSGKERFEFPVDEHQVPKSISQQKFKTKKMNTLILLIEGLPTECLTVFWSSSNPDWIELYFLWALDHDC